MAVPLIVPLTSLAFGTFNFGNTVYNLLAKQTDTLGALENQMAMTTNNDKTTRRESPPIKVYCLPGERRQIEANANAAGLSLSTYLLNVGIG
jgi:hypothetical protein